MNCEQYRDLISARLDGEIDDDEAAALEVHLKQCDECAEFARQLNELHALTADSPPAPMPTELEQAILARTSHRHAWWRRLVSGHYRIPRPLAWAAVVALILLAIDALRSPIVPNQNGTNGGSPAGTQQAVQRIVLTESDVVRTCTTQSVSEDM